MNPIEVKAGDVFGTSNPNSNVGWGIEKIQKWNSRDNESIYTHSGVIINSEGDTIESLWTVCTQNIFEDYSTNKIIIARWDKLTDLAWENSYQMLMGHYGDKYPFWRLPLHIIPPLAKYLSFTGMPVCSELVAKHLYYIGARHRWWTGTCPDTLADEWRRWKGYTIVFEGVNITNAKYVKEFSNAPDRTIPLENF